MNKKTMADDLDPLDPLSGFEDEDPLSSYPEDEDPLSSYPEDEDPLSDYPEDPLSAYIDNELDLLISYLDEDLDRDAFIRCRLGR